MTYVDSHCHLADYRFDLCREKSLSLARQSNINTFIQGGVGPSDWMRQLELQQTIPGLIPVIGLHPYWVIEHDLDECERALDQLSRLLGQKSAIKALGEIGLDYRPSVLTTSRNEAKEEIAARQMTVFELQLELAQVAKKPIVFHIVRAFSQAIKCLQLFGSYNLGGMIHAFNGSMNEAQAYMDLGLHISIGCAACRIDNQKLHQAILHIPMDRILIETDAPDQPPEEYKGDINEISNLILVAQAIAKIKNISKDEVLDSTAKNAKKLFLL